MKIIKLIYITAWLLITIMMLSVSLKKLIESIKNKEAVDIITFIVLILFVLSSIILKFA